MWQGFEGKISKKCPQRKWDTKIIAPDTKRFFDASSVLIPKQDTENKTG
jgi:hypothetical protein